MISKMKIALFISSFRGGGAERAMLVFSSELIRRGYDVDLVVSSSKGPLATSVPMGVRIVDLGQPRMMRAIFALSKYLKRERPQVIYSTVVHANVGCVIASKISGTNVPVVVRESNVPVTEPKKTFSRWLTFKLVPLTYSRARAVIAVSDGVAAELRAVSPKLASLIHVVPTPVIYPELLAKAELPSGHPWIDIEAVPVIVGAARLQPHKGFVALVRAFAEIRAAAPLRLIILGEGPEHDRILNEAARLNVADDVSLPGFIDNPFPFMKKAAVFALVSEYEGMPNVLVQAMALATPVVATNCPSGPSEVLEGGKYGELIPVNDHAALVAALRKLIGSNRRHDSAERVRAVFGSEEATTRYLAVAGIGGGGRNRLVGVSI